MKKIGISFLFCLLFLVSCSVFAYSAMTEQFVTSFEQKLKPMPAKEKTSYLKLIESILQAPQVQQSSRSEVQLLARELTDWLNKKLGKPSSQSVSFNSKASDGTNYQDLPYVDFDKVRSAWLGWHNEMRMKEGLESYVYHSDLEKSAKNWADYLTSIKQWTHKRKDTDGYYNYQSIKDWFTKQGIQFAPEKGGRNAFSESIGYRYYACSAGDCTQALIDATKKSFDGFAAEGKNGSHYKAIMMPHFRQMGLGFQVEPTKKYIYVVIHYAENIVE